MMSAMNYEIDNLDRSILRILQKDARTPYLEIARELDVSGGTIHVRINKMKDAGLLRGTRQQVDYRALGLDVTAMVGIRVAGGPRHPGDLRQAEGNSRDRGDPLHHRGLQSHRQGGDAEHGRSVRTAGRQAA